MFRRSGKCQVPLHWGRKYPYLISFHKFPWEVVKAEGDLFHTTMAEHYEQLLTLASNVQVPRLLLKKHVETTEAKWLSVLPGTAYILPQTQKIQPLPNEELEGFDYDSVSWGPLGWEGKRLPLCSCVHAYGGIASRIASIDAVHLFISPDFRLHCNAVSMSKLMLSSKPGASLRSFHESQEPFTLFHFFRPNRSPAELVRPFSKYYFHHPDMTTLEKLTHENWTPKLTRGTSSKTKATLVPFTPPMSYLPAPPERDAIIPGDCFGLRSVHWGHWF